MKANKTILKYYRKEYPNVQQCNDWFGFPLTITSDGWNVLAYYSTNQWYYYILNEWCSEVEALKLLQLIIFA